MSTTFRPTGLAPYLPGVARPDPRGGAVVAAELVEPVRKPAAAVATDLSTLGVVELLLKDQPTLDQSARGPATQRELIPRLLAIGLSAYAVFGFTLATFFATAGVWPHFTAAAEYLSTHGKSLIEFVPTPELAFWTPWFDGSAFKVTAAYALGMIGAIGVCLPSFYFYGLLSGVRTSILHVTLFAVEGIAGGAIALMAALPIYFAIVLGLVVFDAPHAFVSLVGYVGLALPFIAGLWGTRTLYVGFFSLTDTMKSRYREARECFLRRMLLSWSVCFTAVTPVMIFTLWEMMTR